ncbi:tRNA 2-thiouridine(34) synthase MnmA [Thioalkalivibrio sp. HK1]|uniref:tRNA 2-thiouridine(34) synthase MnmA n=1 Tax=Thioalkalivibrio sp. HK1 TaxID=1469245 RepID=UPI000471714B|nr:tRNA 2-thiouridine(34) synthase MnmA [Thioalkalivibrio sp. HK1]
MTTITERSDSFSPPSEVLAAIEASTRLARPSSSQVPSRSASVMVALSGGVDSALALLLLVKAGVPVQAMFMKNWEEDDTSGHCTAAEDLADARKVCDRLQVPLHTVNCADIYWDRVFTPFLRDIEAGHTPNPDVLCNREVKFSAFADHAERLGADLIATGHYARIERSPKGIRLLKGRDTNKDQSYFLHALDQKRLARSIFPLGDLQKTQVRSWAKSAELAPFAKRDSTGICFVGERRFTPFLERFLPWDPGPIESVDGERLGQHRGLAFFTLGQRKGLNVGGRSGDSGEPWYVAAKDHARNALILVQGGDHRALFRSVVTLRKMHWIAGVEPPLPLRCHAKIRYRQEDQACEALANPMTGKIELHFDTPQRAVTSGQYAVLYRQDECLGGAAIEDAR